MSYACLKQSLPFVGDAQLEQRNIFVPLVVASTVQPGSRAREGWCSRICVPLVSSSWWKMHNLLTVMLGRVRTTDSKREARRPRPEKGPCVAGLPAVGTTYIVLVAYSKEGVWLCPRQLSCWGSSLSRDSLSGLDAGVFVLMSAWLDIRSQIFQQNGWRLRHEACWSLVSHRLHSGAWPWEVERDCIFTVQVCLKQSDCKVVLPKGVYINLGSLGV